MSNVTGFGGAERLRAEVAPSSSPIHALVAHELDRVEAMFRRNLASPVRMVEEVGDFVANGGGKRVRPTLHLLCAKLCGYRGDHDVLLATVLEFIHSATLIHDDIIDEARIRRGRPSVNYQWGNNFTVLFGDYLFAKAMEMALRAGSLPVMEKLAEVTLRMTEGEMIQTGYVGRLDLQLDEYLDLIERKTASLFGCCCELAGMLAGVEQRRQEALRRYGLNLGMAFQLVDDLLDFTGDAKELGKPAASDLREGKATLAVIDLLGDGRLEDQALARRVMDRGDSEGIRLLTDRLHQGGAIKRSHQRARRYAEAALTELAPFDPGPAHAALSALPDLLLSRTR